MIGPAGGRVGIDSALVAVDDLERSLAPGGAHHFLAQLAGDWEGTARTYFQPGVLADESPITGTIRPVLAGRFVLHEYESSIQGEALHGVALYGYDLGRGAYVTAWVDSFHNGTAVMLSEGGDAEAGLSVLGSYGDTPGEPWGWRTEVNVTGSDGLEITHFNIPPGTDGVPAVEIAYRRIRG